MWQTGDDVIITFNGQMLEGTVILASTNSVSLMLGFEAIIDGHVGMMPVLRGDDSIYRSIVTNSPVTLHRPIVADPTRE